MPPIASIRAGKVAQLTRKTWSISMPRYCSIVLMVSAGPPIAYAALILSRPWPGMSTTVSRGIESFALCPPPERRSMMLSDRLGPETVAPGSRVPGERRSEPRTSVVCGLVSPTPPLAGWAWAESGTAACWRVALTRNRTRGGRRGLNGGGRPGQELQGGGVEAVRARGREPLDDAADRDALAPLRRCPGR